jgi:hypothetical protein
MGALRIISTLACPLSALAQLGWGGKWMMLPMFVSVVAAVFLNLREREIQHLDEPTTLRLTS